MTAQEKSGVKADTKGSKAATDTKTDAARPSTAESNSPSTMQKGSTAADSKSSTESRTTGNAATSATVAPPAEKRTQIVSAFREERVQEVTNVNFNIAVGAVVPATVHFYPLPRRIVEIYPEWRGFEFVLVHGRWVIVRPQTHEIVYILEG